MAYYRRLLGILEVRWTAFIGLARHGAQLSKSMLSAAVVQFSDFSAASMTRWHFAGEPITPFTARLVAVGGKVRVGYFYGANGERRPAGKALGCRPSRQLCRLPRASSSNGALPELRNLLLPDPILRHLGVVVRLVAIESFGATSIPLCDTTKWSKVIYILRNRGYIHGRISRVTCYRPP